MTFQFLCPQGHLLQGEEAHMGMECQCPQCGTAFIIPTVAGAQPAAGGGSTVDDLIAKLPPDPEVDAMLPESMKGPSQPPLPSETEASQPDDVASFIIAEVDGLSGAIVDEAILHIPCPNGHELETLPEMIGHRAKCPECGVEFRLRREKSIEFQYQQKVLDDKRAQFWLRVAIVTAVAVVLAIVVMVVAMVMS